MCGCPMRRPLSSLGLAAVLAASVVQTTGRLSAQQPAAQAQTPGLTEATGLLEQPTKLPPAERAKAVELAEQALALREKELGPDHTEVADAVYTLASLIRGGGDNPRALPLLQRTIAILDKGKPESNELATVLNTLGQTHQALGQYDAARPVFERALAIRE